MHILPLCVAKHHLKAGEGAESHLSGEMEASLSATCKPPTISPPPPIPPTPSPYEFTGAFACRPIQQRERQLVDSGPIWRAPSVAGVLRNLPFMRHAPPQVLEVCPHTLRPAPSHSSLPRPLPFLSSPSLPLLPPKTPFPPRSTCLAVKIRGIH